MELFITRKQLQDIIISYYKEFNNEDVDVQITHNTVFNEYFTSGSKDVEVTYKVITNKNILNQQIKTTYQISIDDILKIFKEMLTNYDIEYLKEEKEIGYAGIYEEEYSIFKGITLNVKEKELKRELKQK